MSVPNQQLWPLKALFFPNGCVVVFNNQGQMPELQTPWLLHFAAFLETKCIDPLEVHMTLPNGDQAHFFRTGDGGLNWRIERDGRSIA